MRGTVTYRWQPGNKKTKFGAKSTVYNNRRYDSKREAAYAEQLDWRIKAGELKEVAPQFTLGLYLSGMLWAKWKIDFKVVLKDGTIELHEVKGFKTRDFLLKKKTLLLCQASEFDTNYITDYQTGNKLDKNIKLIVIR